MGTFGYGEWGPWKPMKNCGLGYRIVKMPKWEEEPTSIKLSNFYKSPNSITDLLLYLKFPE
jgi:hypothetical protein